jgi:hypothetical protein
MCLRDSSQTICNHPECQTQTTSFNPIAQVQTSKVMETMVSMLVNRQAMLANLFESSKLLLARTETLNYQKKEQRLKEIIIPHPYILHDHYDYKMIAVYPLVNTVYKEKGFSLTLKIQDSDLNLVEIKELFKVKLFSSENPPKYLKLNISSKKIIRGTVEACMDSKRMVCFENVVINEVSSHYYNETFNLVATCENSRVRPFVIENLSVRARNFHKKDRNSVTSSIE